MATGAQFTRRPYAPLSLPNREKAHGCDLHQRRCLAMSETSENVAKAAENTANAATEAVKAERAPVRKAVTLLKRNPLGVVALVGAAAALIEIELAVGILAGIG